MKDKIIKIVITKKTIDKLWAKVPYTGMIIGSFTALIFLVTQLLESEPILRSVLSSLISGLLAWLVTPLLFGVFLKLSDLIFFNGELENFED